MVSCGNDILGFLILVALLAKGTDAWTRPVPSPTWHGSVSRSTLVFSARSNDHDSESNHLLNLRDSDARREQEMILEELSMKGAAKIAKMDISERAKRAMLAEALEDRVFELTEALTGMLDEDGSVKLEHRTTVADTAKQTKELQLLYSDLVNGNPSSILNALASLDSKDTDI